MEIKYSHIEQIERKLNETESILNPHGIFFERIREIPYGVQLAVSGPNDEGKAVIYYSPKRKSFSAAAIKHSDSTQKLISCVGSKPVFSLGKEVFQAHFGSDEAGKGDYFGPLITAAFFVDSPQTGEDLMNLGVCDSKRLEDGKIAEIARVLDVKYKRNIALVRPCVESYNEMYSKFRNLNILLGAMHAMAFDDLKKLHPQINLACFDKFGEAALVNRFLLKYPEMKIEATVHGESSDIAIAAASIIARSCFVEKMGILSRKYKMKIPLGAGDNVIEAGKIFISRFGRENLKYVAKLHFQTTAKLEGGL